VTAVDAGPVTASQVRSFVDDGFLVVPDLVAEEVRVAVGAEVVRFARGEYPLLNPLDIDPAASDEEATAGVLAIHFAHYVSPVARALITHPGVAGVVSQIAGAHLAHWDGRVKCMQSMLFLKPAGLPGQAWHQDERFIPTRDRSLVGAWIALDDATVDNGCLWVVPGSHRMGYLWPTRQHDNPEEFDPADEAYGFDEDAAVPVEVKAGSVVFFNGYMLHRSFRNRSDRTRRALVNHYCSAWTLLPWPLPPREVYSTDIPTLDNRAVVVVGEDPYAWKGLEPEPGLVYLRPATGG
jgi:phytanoyl-CoA hydroxylase